MTTIYIVYILYVVCKIKDFILSYSLAFSKAVIMILFAADKIKQGQYEFVPTKIISGALNIPNPTAVKIIHGLSRAGIIETREGAKGGIRLAREPSAITVLDVFEAIELNRPLFRNDFNINVKGAKPTLSQQSISLIFANAEDKMKTELKKVTIEKLIKEINQ